ncbi:MAG: PDZ domain-containing protein, partial [Deltaproteobacteria bacterium]|nr:PDZ domain-containing protein [Deltaproteobacteria bacterium]
MEARRFRAYPLRARKVLGWIVIVACGAEAIWQAGKASGEAQSPFAVLGTFARVLSHIEAAYVEPPELEALVYGAIRGMVNALDPHSAFLDPTERAIFEDDTSGHFAGIGVEIDVKDGWLIIQSVLPGGPAERAGIRPGDRFLAIANRNARDMRISEAIRL